MDAEILSKGEQTRHQIIETAHGLFLKQGYHGTSMREIAKNGGIALGGIYNHFATKEEIFRAVFLYYHPINHVFPALLQARGNSTEERLRDIARHVIEGLKENPDFINLLFIDIVEFQGRNSSGIIEEKMPFLEEIYSNIAHSSKNDLRSIPPLIFMRSFFGLFFSYYMTGYILNINPNIPPEINENAFNYFVEIYLHGVLADKIPDGGGEPL
jgi:AcrR family transcriptional regulator